VDDVVDRITESLKEQEALSVIRPTKNGCLVRIASEPLAGGGWVATHEDVTERQQLLEVRERAEALAREKSAQLDAALNNMAHGICLHDADGNLVVFNRRYCEFMGEKQPIQPGSPLVDVLRRRAAAGEFLPGSWRACGPARSRRAKYRERTTGFFESCAIRSTPAAGSRHSRTSPTSAWPSRNAIATAPFSI
jgi:PAS domain-containing protein